MARRALYSMFGIVTVLNTPFKLDGSVDEEGMKKNVNNALKAGVAGFLVPAMASEVHKLSHNERIRLLEVVLEEVNERVPVIAGSSESDFNACKKILQANLDLGCRKVLLQLPYVSETQFKDNFRRLADLGPEMIMLQDWDFFGYGLPDDLILSLFEEVEAFKCLKIETAPAGVKYSRLMSQTDNELHVSGGWGVMQMMEGLKRGLHAFMPTGMHDIYAKIYRDFIEGREADAERLFYNVLPVLAFSNQHLDISVHFFKRLLMKQGVFESAAVRQPILPFDDVHEKTAEPLIDRVIGLENAIKQNLYSC